MSNRRYTNKSQNIENSNSNIPKNASVEDEAKSVARTPHAIPEIY